MLNDPKKNKDRGPLREAVEILEDKKGPKNENINTDEVENLITKKEIEEGK